MTPREFRLLRDGFYRREDRAWQKVATLGVWVISPYSKKKFTPQQLLGRSKFNLLPPVPATEDDHEAQLEVEKARVLAEALAWAEGD